MRSALLVLVVGGLVFGGGAASADEGDDCGLSAASTGEEAPSMVLADYLDTDVVKDYAELAAQQIADALAKFLASLDPGLTAIQPPALQLDEGPIDITVESVGGCLDHIVVLS